MPRSERLADAARSAPAVASVLRRHLGRSAAKSVSVVLRGAPAPVRARVGAVAARLRRPDLAALAVAASGRGDDARRLLEQALDADPSAATARRVAEAAVVLHQPGTAARALAVLPGTDRHGSLVRAGLLAEDGQLAAAVHAAAQAPGMRARGLERRLRGETEVLRHRLLDEVLAAVPDHTPVLPEPGPRTVLHVVSNALPEVQAGYTLRTQGIAAAQAARGQRPHVVTRLGFPVDSGALAPAREVTVDGIPHHRLLPARPLPLPGREHQRRWAEELDAVVQSVRPSVLHAHSKHENAQAALMVGHRRRIPVVYEVRGLLEETWRSRRGGQGADTDLYRWSRDAETRCMTSAAAVVTLAGTMREEVVARGVDPHRVHVVPNCVPESFTAPLPAGGPVRARLGIPEGATVFGTVTTVNGYEGLDTLVAAAALLDDVVVLVVGDGPDLARVRDLAAPLGPRAVFTGRVRHQQVREHLAAMDVFCVPRRATPVTVLVPPLKPLEAMAAGLPVLASDLPPLVETVQPGRFGQVAAPDDAAAWAERMSALRYAPDDVRTMGEHARAWVSEHRTWAVAADRYDAVYTQVMGTGFPDGRTDGH